MGTSDQNLPETSFFTSVWGNLRNAIIGCSAAVLFGLAVLLLSILSATSPQKVFPQGVATVSAQSASPTPRADYYLPYPGILPDNPLYTLKTLRDRVRLWLTFDEGRKAQWELLYADKRINAAQALVAGGKVELGISTATKGEKYLEQAVDREIKMQKSGRDVKSDLMVLSKAVDKHLEILQDLKSRAMGSEGEVLYQTGQLTRSLQGKVGQAILEAK